MAKINNLDKYNLEELPKNDYVILEEKKCNVCRRYKATIGEKCESCHGVLAHSFRRSGKTTRLINRCIDEFFEKGITYVYEGRGEPTEKLQTKEAFYLFKKRMNSEHSNQKYKFEYGEFDKVNCFKVTKK